MESWHERIRTIRLTHWGKEIPAQSDAKLLALGTGWTVHVSYTSM